ncbi:hypothetical protein GOL30_12655 [Sinorhizobium medicae]|uniref:hypothetical protein n=1 Tax=Sinorhizobium medicae TaxID=110321 RepID=UPI00041494F7|nr:hypothetical protein [Sinorhizobium medicae]MDX0429929.1 hypothetical protein [Sinorhizobium medicae]MDX0460607.1 hypothetical protein [Sinorhizobium medicae]MDX0533043.1 hypothetical protein [Sinorhizobium medicae]MDX0572653.1 hypothetical protein [Sinorhizobium medicae]MDX0600511.1 hypothetical protein [Sinorhizobium medicae]
MNYRPIVKALIKEVRKLDTRLQTHEAMESMYEDDEAEDLKEAHKTLADVREQIMKGDTEYAVELIGREIGYY